MPAKTEKKRVTKSKIPAPRDPAKQIETEQVWDEVSEASWESFPASDPPAWTRSRAGEPSTETSHAPKKA